MKKNLGFSLVEIIVSISVLAIAFIGLMGFIASSYQAITVAKHEEQALLAAKEAMEAVRNFRDNTEWTANGVGSLSTGTAYHSELIVDGATTTWSMAAGIDTAPISRQIIFSPVSRDTISKNIENPYNSSHIDTQTRLVTITATFGQAEAQLQAYFTNWN